MHGLINQRSNTTTNNTAGSSKQQKNKVQQPPSHTSSSSVHHHHHHHNHQHLHHQHNHHWQQGRPGRHILANSQQRPLQLSFASSGSKASVNATPPSLLPTSRGLSAPILMIRNIELNTQANLPERESQPPSPPAVITEGNVVNDPKEEEKESLAKMPERRDSLSSEDNASLGALPKLNTIEEKAEQQQPPATTPPSISSSSFWSFPAQKVKNIDLKQQQQQQLLDLSSSPESNAASIANSTTVSAATEEQLQNSCNTQLENSSNQQQQEEEERTQPAQLKLIITEALVNVTSTTSSPATSTTSLPQLTPSPSDSPQRKSSASSKWRLSKTPSHNKITNNLSPTTNGGGSSGSTGTVGNAASAAASSGRFEEDSLSKSSDTSTELIRGGAISPDAILPLEKTKSASRLSERVKKKSWYNVLYPNYKSRSEDFKKLFKEVPNDERLIVDYSCALQREILAQGRLYVSQNFVCFHANIFSWETFLTIRWKDVTSINKEKTALVIPNAISIHTSKEKYFFATFTARDKSYLMLFRVWQNALMNKPLLPHEMWQWVHNSYGEELGLTTDDEDYIDPSSVLNDTEDSTDFATALEDAQSLSTSTAASATSGDQKPSNSTAFGTVVDNHKRNGSSGAGARGAGSGNNSSGASSGGGGTGSRTGSGKVKRSYFFSSNKSNSNTASPSGSDNKASDSGGGGSGKLSKSQMKSNAKELTLISAAPDEANESKGESAKTHSTGAIPKDTKGKDNGGGSASVYDIKRKVSKNSRQRDESAGKNVEEQIPTDMSDSSDSDQKIPFVATAECNSLHEGRQIMHTILPINVDTVFNLLFGKSKFLENFHAMRRSTDCVFGEWQINEEGQRARSVNVTVMLAASVGPKTSRVTEQQVMRDCSKPGELYSIDVNSVNSGIPYADSFCVILHYCLVKTVDDNTMLSLHAQIKYKKSIWGVVKGLIEKNTWAGLEDFYSALLQALQNETCIPPAKGKGRRPRKGKAKRSTALMSTKAPSSDGSTASHTPSTVTTSAYTIANTNPSVLSKHDTLKSSISLTSHCIQTCRKHHHCQHHHHQASHKGVLSVNRPTEEPPPVPVKTESTEPAQLAPLAHAPALPAASEILPEQSKRRNAWLSVFVVILLCFLVTMNVILLLRLWRLEVRIEEDIESRRRMPNLAALKELPNSPQEWLDLLRQQEMSHEAEMRKWHTALQSAIELLKKVSIVCRSLLAQANDDYTTQQLQSAHDEL